MQEFVFTVTYDRGSDPIADVFINYPEVVMTSLSCSVTEDSIWYLNRITGPTAALEQLDDIFLDPTHCNECLDAQQCSTEWAYELLSSGETSRTVYAYGTDGDDCHSIPILGVTHLGDGLFYDAERRGDQYRWRILVPDDAQVGDLYDTINGELRDGLRLRLDHLTEPTRWGDTVVSLAESRTSNGRCSEKPSNGDTTKPREQSPRRNSPTSWIPHSQPSSIGSPAPRRGLPRSSCRK